MYVCVLCDVLQKYSWIAEMLFQIFQREKTTNKKVNRKSSKKRTLLTADWLLAASVLVLADVNVRLDLGSFGLGELVGYKAREVSD